MARAFTSIFLLYLLLTLVGCPSSPSPATDAVVEDAYVDAFSPSDVEIDVVDTSSPQDTSTPDIVVDVVSDSTVPTDTFDTTPPVDIITPPSCADGDKCTIDVWDDEAGECIYYSVNCDDGTPCTIDNCIPESGCEFVWQDDEGCCLEDEDCDDGNLCTLNVCENKMCQTIIDPTTGCCQVDDDCDDNDPCAQWACIDNQCYSDPKSPPDCCYQDSDCPALADCSIPVCFNGICTQTSTCCQNTEQCPPTNECSAALCQEGWCIPQQAGPDCCDASSPLLSVDFEDEAPTDLLLLNSDDTVGWNWVEEHPVSSSSVLYYGNLSQLNYVADQAHQGQAKTIPISIPAESTTLLSFDTFVEIQTETLLDQLLLEVHTEEGEKLLVWDKSELQLNQWQTVLLNLSAFAGQTVELVWLFDTVTTDSNHLIGVVLDNLVLSTDCQEASCLDDGQCNDGLAITLDACVLGKCAHQISPAYCGLDSIECDDGNPCTHDLCDGFLCTHADIPDCCQFHSECEDGKACTVDLCDPIAGCISAGSENCCTADQDCDDGDPCTTETCGPSGCEYIEVASCCTSNEACFDGNECTMDICVEQQCQHLTLCCGQVADCTNTDPLCTTVSCDNNQCAWTYIDEPGCCKNLVWSQAFDGNNPLSDWTLVSDNDPQDEVQWQVVTELLSATPPGALYYGNSQALNYDTGDTGNIAEIATPAIKLPSAGHIELAFQIYLANEFAAGGYPNPDWDRLTVWVYPPNTMPVLLWDSGWGEPQWWTANEDGEPISALWVEVDKLMLTHYADQYIQLGFRFDTKDGSNNDYLGVLVDDILITTTCTP